jgi:hypothetical protein
MLCGLVSEDGVQVGLYVPLLFQERGITTKEIIVGMRTNDGESGSFTITMFMEILFLKTISNQNMRNKDVCSWVDVKLQTWTLCKEV